MTYLMIIGETKKKLLVPSNSYINITEIMTQAS